MIVAAATPMNRRQAEVERPWYGIQGPRARNVYLFAGWLFSFWVINIPVDFFFLL
jgi:hypothetical protein